MGVTHQGAESVLLREAKRCASSPAAGKRRQDGFGVEKVAAE